MYKALVKAARANHKYTPDENEINELCDAIDDMRVRVNALDAEVTYFKELYISTLKKMDDELCEKCAFNHKCDGEKCPFYEAGRGGWINDQYVDWEWSCQDLNYGECAVLKNTPCNGCFDNDFAGFKLKERPAIKS